MVTDLGLYASLKALSRMPLRRAFRTLLEILRLYWRARVSRGATGEVPLLRRLANAGQQRAEKTFSMSIAGEDVTRFVRSIKLEPRKPDAAFPIARPRIRSASSLALGQMKLSEVPVLPAFAQSVREAMTAELTAHLQRSIERHCLSRRDDLLNEVARRMTEIRKKNLRRAQLAKDWSAEGGKYLGIFCTACRSAHVTFLRLGQQALLAEIEAGKLVPEKCPTMSHPSAAKLAAWLDRVTDEAEEISIAGHLVACRQCREWAEDVRWLEAEEEAADQP